jgi:two-component system sensor histidine kinase BaeS
MMRPLDRVGSIKLKLGVLVGVTVTVASAVSVAGLLVGVWPRYTIPVAVVASLVVTQLLARGMTSPLREMTAAARAMATGDYTLRVTATSRDEVGQLARAFNTMAADLAAVDRQRRELVANVSHELRTPVSALHAVLENLVDGVSRPDHATLVTALHQTERLGRLVDDLLDLSRVDAGITPLETEPVRLRELLEDAVDEARVSADHLGREVTYQVTVEPDDLVVEADPARLHQLVANLLDNAGRHSPRGGLVTVTAHGGSDRVRLDVVDQGPGIPPAERTAVFERFSTGAPAPGAPDGGTGLGLAISRWVTDLHRGSVEVAPTATGCHLRVTLPPRRSLP